MSCNKYFIMSIVSVSFVYYQYVATFMSKSDWLSLQCISKLCCLFGDFFQGIGISSLGQER